MEGGITLEILILTCGTGGGHNAAAYALRDKMTQMGHHVQCFNPYDLYDKKLSAHIDQAYIRLVQTAPHLFGALYTLGDLYRHLPIHSPVYHLNGRMARVMERYFDDHPTDVVVMTHIFPGQILSAMRRAGMAVPRTVLVATDYTCIPFAEECECDAYVVPSDDLVEEFVSRGVPRQRIHALGIPVADSFSAPLSRQDAKLALDLDPTMRYIVMAGGSMGAGKPEKTVETLLRLTSDRGNVRILTICGSNHQLEERLRARFGHHIDVVGRTDRMALYLRACDLYLTKPGGLSTTEAAVSGTALGLLSAIPGCETHNLDFYESHGMCRRVEPTEESLERFVGLLDDDEARRWMQRRQQQTIHPDAAWQITRLAEGLVRRRPCRVWRPYGEGPMPLRARSW